MATKRELEERIKELERKVANLENRFDVYGQCFAITKDKIRKEIEDYVQKHIWYTAVENQDAFEKGQHVKVLIKELAKTLDSSEEPKGFAEAKEERKVGQWC